MKFDQRHRETARRAESWQEMLRATPLHNPAAEVACAQDGLVAVTVQARKPRYLIGPLAWIIRLRLTRTYRLDRLGSQVWNLCDGRREVERIVEIFAEQHRLTFHEARVAVTGYLRQLIERGAIAVQFKRMPEPES